MKQPHATLTAPPLPAPLKPLLLLLLLLLVCDARPADGLPADWFTTLQGAPRLQFRFGGCSRWWCETGWYSSAAVADLDGRLEAVGAGSGVFAADAHSGRLLWAVKSGYDITAGGDVVVGAGRTWASVVVADIDADGVLEVISAHASGTVSVYTPSGVFKPGWPRVVTPDLVEGSAGESDGQPAFLHAATA
eukprot:CAMPEP_0177670256 /NCGR_PEP_ID=MMETSP0447-20121125/23977_1 /TAXON_ID=0 /ORGANISM="Stygamoeba regulata, Strain BSH-02190019" /LENGTH=190 /DNA_ID=CAMNT_0019177377 /DNA_START=224 /DNA_END=792 /DNA_ORIENTATION=-